MPNFQVLTSIIQALLTSTNISLHTAIPEDDSWLAKEEITDSITPVDPALMWTGMALGNPEARAAIEDALGLPQDDASVDTLDILEDELASLMLDEEEESIINQREAYRVRPSSLEPVRGQLQIGERQIPVQLRDISLTGFGVYLDETDLSGLETRQMAELQLRFPNGHPGASYPVELRHVYVDAIEELGVIGMMISDTSLDVSTEGALRAYVMERQRQRCRLRVRRQQSLAQTV